MTAVGDFSSSGKRRAILNFWVPDRRKVLETGLEKPRFYKKFLGF